MMVPLETENGPVALVSNQGVVALIPHGDHLTLVVVPGVTVAVKGNPMDTATKLNIQIGRLS